VRILGEGSTRGERTFVKATGDSSGGNLSGEESTHESKDGTALVVDSMNSDNVNG
jgi:hypothetical protein